MEALVNNFQEFASNISLYRVAEGWVKPCDTPMPVPGSGSLAGVGVFQGVVEPAVA